MARRNGAATSAAGATAGRPYTLCSARMRHAGARREDWASSSQVRAAERTPQRTLGALLRGGCGRRTRAWKAPSEWTKASAPAYAEAEASLPPKLCMPELSSPQSRGAAPPRLNLRGRRQRIRPAASPWRLPRRFGTISGSPLHVVFLAKRSHGNPAILRESAGPVPAANESSCLLHLHNAIPTSRRK